MPPCYAQTKIVWLMSCTKLIVAMKSRARKELTKISKQGWKVCKIYTHVYMVYGELREYFAVYANYVLVVAAGGCTAEQAEATAKRSDARQLLENVSTRTRTRLVNNPSLTHAKHPVTPAATTPPQVSSC